MGSICLNFTCWKRLLSIYTLYVSNSYTPYHINMWQIPNPTDEGATTTEMYFDSRFAYHYARNGIPEKIIIIVTG